MGATRWLRGERSLSDGTLRNGSPGPSQGATMSRLLALYRTQIRILLEWRGGTGR